MEFVQTGHSRSSWTLLAAGEMVPLLLLLLLLLGLLLLLEMLFGAFVGS